MSTSLTKNLLIQKKIKLKLLQNKHTLSIYYGSTSLGNPSGNAILSLMWLLILDLICYDLHIRAVVEYLFLLVARDAWTWIISLFAGANTLFSLMTPWLLSHLPLLILLVAAFPFFIVVVFIFIFTLLLLLLFFMLLGALLLRYVARVCWLVDRL